METVKFEELQLDDRILRAVTDMGFEEASPIQAKAIPVELEGCDIIGQAQTGTGKTAAFGIPLLQKIDPKKKKLQAIALCPTRELAIQVADEIRNLARHQDPADLRRTGYRAPDSWFKGRYPDHHRYSGPCYGPYAPQDREV